MQDLAGVIGPWFEAYREAAPDAAIPSPELGWGRGEGMSPLARPGEGQGVRAVRLPSGASSWRRPRRRAVKWQYAIDDVRDQLARLAGPKCLSTTPWTWLRHCPRYFRAIRVRLDALAGGGIAKDRERV